MRATNDRVIEEFRKWQRAMIVRAAQKSAKRILGFKKPTRTKIVKVLVAEFSVLMGSP